MLFKNLVPDYTPSPQLLEAVDCGSTDDIEKPEVANIIHDEIVEYPDARWRPAAFAPASESS
jgi:hypothetical protein